MASDEKRSAVDLANAILGYHTMASENSPDCEHIELAQGVLRLDAEVEHWKRAYNGAMASLADQALKLGQEAHTARVEAEDLRAANAAMREALEFYAHEPRYGWDNWRNDGSDPFTPDDEPYLIGTSRDRGRIARTALGGSHG